MLPKRLFKWEINEDKYFSFNVWTCLFWSFFSSTTTDTCGKSPKPTEPSATNCRLSWKDPAGSPGKLGSATTSTTPRFASPLHENAPLLPKWGAAFLQEEFIYWRRFTRQSHMKTEQRSLCWDITTSYAFVSSSAGCETQPHAVKCECARWAVQTAAAVCFETVTLLALPLKKERKEKCFGD